MIFAKNFAKNCEKKLMLGMSGAWWMSHSSQRPNETRYYFEDCRISRDYCPKYIYCARRLASTHLSNTPNLMQTIQT